MKPRVKWLRGTVSLFGAFLIALFAGACADPAGGGGGRKLVSIAITANPIKTVYDVGGALDLAGLVVQAAYSDGTSETVANDKLEVSGFDSSKTGEKTVTIKYGGMSAVFTVTVKTRVLESIAVTKNPAKTVYIIGDSLDLAGLVVQATYDDGSTETITSDKLELSGFDSSALGEKTVTVTYGGKSAVFTVTVDKSIKSIAITARPGKTEYYTGQELDVTGLVVQAAYDDNTTETIANDKLTISGFDTFTAGEQTITVSYGSQSAVFTVTVKARILTGIKITALPTKTSYYKDEKLNIAGLEVKALYDNNTEEVITAGRLGISGFDSSAPGEKIISVSYLDKSAEFAVTVKDAAVINLDIKGPDKKEYFVGDSGLELAGLEVTAVYGDGGKVVIDRALLTIDKAAFDTSVPGEKIINVSYGGANAGFTVTVKALVLESISIKSGPGKTKYFMGEDPGPVDLAGLVVEASYDNGTIKEIANNDLGVSGFDLSAAGQRTITVTYLDKSAAFSVTVYELTGISVTKEPDRKEYYVGEGGSKADITGLEVTAAYNPAMTKIIPSDKLGTAGFITNTAGEKTITVSYGGKNTTFTVTVYELDDSLLVTRDPDKTVYLVGDSGPNLTGLEVTASFGNGSTVIIPNDKLEVSGFDTSTAGSKIVTVTYNGKETFFTIEVCALTGISIMKVPDKTEYFAGEALELEGLEVTASYSNNSTGPVDNDDLTINGFNTNVPGEQTVTVSYGSESDDFTVTVYALTAISITRVPFRTEYFVGDSDPDLTGLEVTAHYGEGGPTKIIGNYALDNVSGFDTSVAGEQTVTVSYGGKSDTFTITVYDLTGVNLNMKDIEITDAGNGLGVFINIAPVVLSKSGAVKSKTFSFDEPGCTVTAWRVDNINFGSADSVTLNASAFNPGNYTLTLAFTKDGKSWFAGLDFEVTN